MKRISTKAFRKLAQDQPIITKPELTPEENQVVQEAQAALSKLGTMVLLNSISVQKEMSSILSKHNIYTRKLRKEFREIWEDIRKILKDFHSSTLQFNQLVSRKLQDIHYVADVTGDPSGMSLENLEGFEWVNATPVEKRLTEEEFFAVLLERAGKAIEQLNDIDTFITNEFIPRIEALNTLLDGLGVPGVGEERMNEEHRNLVRIRNYLQYMQTIINTRNNPENPQ